MSARLLALAFLSVVLGTGCSEKKVSSSEVTSAPFDARIGEVGVHVPEAATYRRAVLHTVDGRGDFAAFDLCSSDSDGLPAGCEQFRSWVEGDADGVRIYLRAPQPWTRYTWVRERPSVDPPLSKAMRSLPLSPSPSRMGPSTPSEDYQLSRLQLHGYADRLSTTDRGWPIAACGVLWNRVTCSTGFRIEDMFVEAHWSLPRTSLPDQKEIWAMATVLDQQIRSLIPETRS
jgi:hypothetical protein